MSYLGFLAQGAVISAAVERALPQIRASYSNPDLSDDEIIKIIGTSRLWERQVELRNGRLLGLSAAVGDDVAEKLAREIPRMYDEAKKR